MWYQWAPHGWTCHESFVQWYGDNDYLWRSTIRTKPYYTAFVARLRSNSTSCYSETLQISGKHWQWVPQCSTVLHSPRNISLAHLQQLNSSLESINYSGVSGCARVCRRPFASTLTTTTKAPVRTPSSLQSSMQCNCTQFWNLQSQWTGQRPDFIHHKQC